MSCSDARLEARPRDVEWLFRQFTSTRKEVARLVCSTDKRIDIVVHPVYFGETDITGLAMIVSTRSHRREALLSAAFEERRGPRLSYHRPRCRAGG